MLSTITIDKHIKVASFRTQNSAEGKLYYGVYTCNSVFWGGGGWIGGLEGGCGELGLVIGNSRAIHQQGKIC